MGNTCHKPVCNIFILLIIALLIPLGSAQAGTYFVNDATGSDANLCLTEESPCLTVQGAIEKARDDANNEDTINVAAGTYTGKMDFDINGAVNPDQSKYTVVGAGFNQTFFDGENSSQVVKVELDVTLDLSKVTIQNGNLSADGEGGGGLQNIGTTFLSECVVKDSRSEKGFGGGIANAGTMTITQCTISGNSCTIPGGGISNGGRVNGNPDGQGGLTIVNSTISGNTAGDSAVPADNGVGGGGGGIYNHKTSALSLYNVTVANNTSIPAGLVAQPNGGGGIYSDAGSASEINNSIIAGNVDTNSNDCFGELSSTLAHNLVQVTEGCTFSGVTTPNQNGQNPNLGPLQPNGGNGLPTHALGANSAAIDTGNGDQCLDQNGTPLQDDERGLPRPPNANAISQGDTVCDIGAYEFQKGGGGDDDDDSGGGGCSLIHSALAGNGTTAWALMTLLGLGTLGWIRKRS